MDSGRWARIESVFHEVADRPAADRPGLVAAACQDDPTLIPQVMALLEQDGSPHRLLDRAVGDLAGTLLGNPGSHRFDPEAFRPYRLKSPLGEGGMGIVFLAEREDLGNLVAIKILRDAWLSPGRRQRFLTEQKTLARLTHPNIARLYDADTLPDGTPWFVMEYVDGLPLTEHCVATSAPVAERIRLFRAVVAAVDHAHAHGVIHRDLKPSNILVKSDGSVRLLDFGIAKAVDPEPEGHRTTAPLMTPAYAAPEQLRGEPAGVATDVYSLGVILYELLAGRLPFGLPRVGGAPIPTGHVATRPSVAAKEAGPVRPPVSTASPSAWADLDTLCLTAMHDDPDRRYQSAAALGRDLDHFLAGRALEARPDSLPYQVGRFLNRRGRLLLAAVVLFTLGAAAARLIGPTPLAAAPAVTVMPLRTEPLDSIAAHLPVALAEEITTALGGTPGLTVRPVAPAGRPGAGEADPVQVGRDTRATSVVSGRVRRIGGTIRVELEAVDVATGKRVWADVVEVPAGDPIALHTALAGRARLSLAAALGAPAGAATSATRPRHPDAYDRYLRSVGAGYDPGASNDSGIAMLEQAVALDSTYAPAWLALARRYYMKARFETGDSVLLERTLTSTQRAVALDPDYVVAGARMAGSLIERGQLAAAYQQLTQLVARRPDSPDAHFWLSYVLRFAGLTEESNRECATALSLDPHNFGWRSCAVAAMARDDYDGARGYLALDPRSEWTKALGLHLLVRAGRVDEARQLDPPRMPQWKSYTLLLACLANRPQAEVTALAAAVVPDSDPEANYFAAAHLAWCGLTDASLSLLGHAIRGNYCSFPVMDADPLFARTRAAKGYAEVREAGRACQRDFLAARAAPPSADAE